MIEIEFKKFIYESINRPIRLISNLADTPAIILIYHRIIKIDHDPQLLAVKPENFYNQIKHLANNYNLLTIEQFTELKLSQKKFPPKSIIITFDDGYYDNFTEALPILESFKTQALFFITTSLLNSNEESWWDKIDNLFFSDIDFPPFITIDKNLKLNTSAPKNKIRAYQKIHNLMKYSKPVNQKRILERLFEQTNFFPKNRKNYRYMTFKEIELMNNSEYAVIGVHTHSHIPLSVLNSNEQEYDITKSRNILEGLTGNTIDFFSYPFGVKKDFNKQSIEICKKLNFRLAFANYYSQVHRWSNNYSLPRVIVRDWDINKFSIIISKAFRY